jgi:hypothetical protein
MMERDAVSLEVLAAAPAESEGGLTFVFRGAFGGIGDIAILLDTGATFNFVSIAWLKKHKLTGLARPTAQPFKIRCANDEVVQTTQEVQAVCMIQGVATEVTALVLPTLLEGVQLILGSAWQSAHAAVLHAADGMVQLTVQGTPQVLRAVRAKGQMPRGAVRDGPEEWCCTAAQIRQAQEEPLFTGKQAAKAIRQGAEVWLHCVVAVEAGDGGQSPELKKLLQEFQDVFEEPRGVPETGPRPVGHLIRLLPGSEQAPYRRPFRLSPDQERE